MYRVKITSENIENELMSPCIFIFYMGAIMHSAIVHSVFTELIIKDC